MWLATSNKRVVFDSTQTALIRYQLWPEQECRKESNLTLYFLYLCNNTAKLLFIIFKSLPIYCPNQRVFICAKLFSFQLFKAQNGHYEIKQHTCLLLQNVLIFNKNLNDKISMDIVYNATCETLRKTCLCCFLFTPRPLVWCTKCHLVVKYHKWNLT